MEIPTHSLTFEYVFYSKLLRKKKLPTLFLKNEKIQISNSHFDKENSNNQKNNKFEILKHKIRILFAFFRKNPGRKQENLSKCNI